MQHTANNMFLIWLLKRWKLFLLISECVDLRLWYTEKNEAFELWNGHFGNYVIGDGLRNGAPYYVNEKFKQYSIWKDDFGNWCSGYSNELNATVWACALYRSGLVKT